MTLVSEIIVDAYRETNLIAVGQEPNATFQSEGLRRLRALILSSAGNDAGFILEDWNVTSAAAITRPSGLPIPAAQTAGFTVKPNSRLIFNLAAPMTIKLDPQPQDGQRFAVVDVAGNFAAQNLTINPNGRRIEGTTSLVLSTNGAANQWFYRSDIADWVRIEGVELAGEMPFPVEFDDYFSTMLAMRLVPRFGKSLPQETKDRLTQQKEQLAARYSQTRLNPSDPPSN